MSNSNFESLRDSFYDPQAWTSEVQGIHQLKDPVSGAYMSSSTPFPWISSDNNLGAGLRYLDTHRGEFKYTMAYSYGLDAEELDSSLGTNWMESLVRNTDYFGYDEPGCTTESVNARNQAAHLVRGAVIGAGKDSYDSFRSEACRLFDPDNTHPVIARQIAAAAMMDKVSFSPDIAADGTAVERAVLDGLRYHSKQKDTPERGLAIAGLMVAREWCIVANCGLYSARNPRSSMTRPLLLMRRPNADLTRKLNIAGALAADVCLQPRSMQAKFGENCNVAASELPDLLRVWRFGIPGLSV